MDNSLMKKINITALTLAALTSLSTQAELLSLSFTDTNGEDITVENSKRFINPTSGVKLKISAGLDRKVSFIVKNSSNNIMDVGESPAISVNDTLTHNGNTYYGYELSTTALPDGVYTFITQLKDYNGTVVDSEVFNFEIDTVKPTITGAITYKYSGWASNDLTVFSNSNFQSISVDGVSDNYEIVSAEIIARKKGSTGPYLKKSAEIDIETNALSITGYPSPIFTGDGEYEEGFEVSDIAGNKRIKTSEFTIDNILPEIGFSDVWNPNTNSWQAYTSGMTVFENPAKFRVRRKADDHTSINGTKYGWETGYSYTEGSYIYNNFTVLQPNSYSYAVFLTKGSKIWVARQYGVNYVLAPGVRQAPKMTGVNHYSSVTDWVNSSTSRTNVPKTISKVKIKTEARGYVQRASISAGGYCDIPIQATECTITTNYTFSSGKGYIPRPTYIKSVTNGVVDGEFSLHSGYLYTYWDFNGGEFISNTITNNSLELVYQDSDRTNNWTQYMWRTTSIKIKAENNNTGVIEEYPASVFNQTTYQQYYVQFDLESLLAEGDYKLTVIATDSYGNETNKTITNSKIIDSTPPVIAIYNEGIESFTKAIGLDGIAITTTDILPSQIISIALAGGPLNSVVYMAWRAENSEYKLEYPRIFPSMVSGEEYSLTVTAKDSVGNQSSKTKVFLYQPPNLEELPKQVILSTDTQLLKANDESYITIKKNNLRRNDGLLLNGANTGFFTLRADSEFSVTIKGITVAPGQTVEVPFNAYFGSFEIPIYPNQKVIGTVNYLFEIISVNVTTEEAPTQ